MDEWNRIIKKYPFIIKINYSKYPLSSSLMFLYNLSDSEGVIYIPRTVCVNEKRISYSAACFDHSDLFKDFLSTTLNSIQYPDDFNYDIISDLLSRKDVIVTKENVDILKTIAKKFGFKGFENKINEAEIISKKTELEISNNKVINTLLQLEEYITDVSENNLEIVLDFCINQFILVDDYDRQPFDSDLNDVDLKNERIDTVLNLIFTDCLHNWRKTEIYSKLLIKLHEKINIITNLKVQFKIVLGIFYQLKNNGQSCELANRLCSAHILTLTEITQEIKIVFNNSSVNNEAAIFNKMLKKDDINGLLQDTKVQNFRFNEEIECLAEDPYDLRSFRRLCPIEYAAFFGSINCFKYLLKRGAKINPPTMEKVAILGGNVEIIHLCQNECGICFINKDHLIKIAIRKKHNEIFEWLFDDYGRNLTLHSYSEDIIDMIHECLKYSNYHIFFYLFGKGVLFISVLHKLLLRGEKSLLLKMMIEISTFYREKFFNKIYIFNFLRIDINSYTVRRVLRMISANDPISNRVGQLLKLCCKTDNIMFFKLLYEENEKYHTNKNKILENKNLLEIAESHNCKAIEKFLLEQSQNTK